MQVSSDHCILPCKNRSAEADHGTPPPPLSMRTRRPFPVHCEAGSVDCIFSQRVTACHTSLLNQAAENGRIRPTRLPLPGQSPPNRTSSGHAPVAYCPSVLTCRGAARTRCTKPSCTLVCKYSFAGLFVCRCLTSRTMLPFPLPAHRSGHVDFPHPALGSSLTPFAHGDAVALCNRTVPSCRYTYSPENRASLRLRIVCLAHHY